MGKTEERLCVYMGIRWFNVSSVRLMRFLYALGFEKESYLTKQGKENWRFKWSEDLEEALSFYRLMRSRNNGS